TFTTTVLPTGLVGAWNFNEGTGTTVHDSSGNSNNGTLSGSGATWTSAGKYGGAAAFNGSSRKNSGPNANTHQVSSSYTLEAWVKPADLSDYRTVLIKEASGGCGYWLQTVDTDIDSGFNNSDCLEHTSGSPAIPLNQWSHLAAVFNDADNTYTLYLNGNAIATDSETAPPGPNTERLAFGPSA